MERLIQRIEKEYSDFKDCIIKELPESIWEKSTQIFFYSNIHEYFLYNQDIPENIIQALGSHINIIAECWQMYLKKEELSIFTWNDITDILELCVKKAGKMSFSEFEEKICEELKRRLNYAEVQAHTVTKNNSVELRAIMISEKGVKVTPTIYLGMYYEEYTSGTELEMVINRIMELYQKKRYRGNVNMEELLQWDNIKDKVVCRLINMEKNKEMLKNVPYIPWFDLAAIFCLVLKEDEEEMATAIINQNLCRTWKKSVEDLMQVAKKNTVSLFPPKKESLRNIIKFMIGKSDLPYDNIKDNMIVLTNTKLSHGAITFLYPNVLSEIAEELQSDLYILPCGIHETIAMPANIVDRQEVLSVVKDMNEHAVLETDFLSDSIYYYDKEKGILCMYSRDMSEREVATQSDLLFSLIE